MGTHDVYLICYDITSNKLRAKIEKKLCDYGVRLQYSVFALRADAETYARAIADLQALTGRYEAIMASADSIYGVRLKRQAQFSTIAGADPQIFADHTVIG